MQCDLQGHPRLVEILAKFYGRILGRKIDPMEEILVSMGAYQAVFCAVQALVYEGDEVSSVKYHLLLINLHHYLMQCPKYVLM